MGPGSLRAKRDVKDASEDLAARSRNRINPTLWRNIGASDETVSLATPNPMNVTRYDVQRRPGTETQDHEAHVIIARFLGV